METKLTRIQRLRQAMEDLRWDEMQQMARAFNNSMSKREKPIGRKDVRWAIYRAEDTAQDFITAIAAVESFMGTSGFVEQENETAEQEQEGE